MMVVLSARRDRGLVRPRRLHDRRLPARGAGAVAGVHARRPQHRLHARRADQRLRPGLRQQRRSCGRCRSSPRWSSRSTRSTSPSCRTPPTTGPPPPRADARRLGAGALRNRGFLALNFCDGVLGTNQVLLNIVIPLWLVQETDAPRVLLAWLFGTNTVMAVLLQVARRPRGRLGRRAPCAPPGSAWASSCSPASSSLVTHDTVGWVTIALVWLGHVTVTGAELFQSAAHWGFMSELSDPDRLGEYQGAASLGSTLGPRLGAGGLHLPRHRVGRRGLAGHRRPRAPRHARHGPGLALRGAVPGPRRGAVAAEPA